MERDQTGDFFFTQNLGGSQSYIARILWVGQKSWSGIIHIFGLGIRDCVMLLDNSRCQPASPVTGVNVFGGRVIGAESWDPETRLS